MPKPTKKQEVSVVSVGKKNRFAVLEESSEDECSDVDVQESVVEETVAPAAPVIVMKPIVEPAETFDEREFTIVRGSRGKQIRTDKDGWTKVEWNKPQFLDSDTESVESEVQIKKELEMEALEATELEYAAEDLPPPVEPEAIPVFSGFMNRGSGINAVAWAEKIKQSLDKAETTRKAPPGIQPTEDFVSGLTKQTGRLSFF